MTGADRFAGPPAAARSGSGTQPLARVPAPPDGSWSPPRDVWTHATMRQSRAQARRDSAGLSRQPASAACSAAHRRTTAPMLSDVWGERLIRLAIDANAFGPAGEAVRTRQELPPHDAFPGGPP